MKIVIAPDSFKDCLPAVAVCAAMAAGAQEALPGATIVTVPMADGGEGTLDVLLAALGGERRTQVVTGPLGAPLTAAWGWQPATRLAIIEAATACGLEHVPLAQRNPAHTTTYGVGELLAAALAAGARQVLLTVGGTATVDGGAGLLQALGYRLLDAAGQDLPRGGGALTRLARLVPPSAQPWQGVALQVACDVRHVLLGLAGAAAVFGPQKGATPAQVLELDAGLGRLAEQWRQVCGVDVTALAGGGAAGGLSAALVAGCGARLVPGVTLVMAAVQLAQHLQGADLVLTGEGRADGQTGGGKVCAGVAGLAQAQGVPCVLLAGAVTGPPAGWAALGVTAALSVAPGPQDLAAAKAAAASQIRATATHACRLYASGLVRASRAPRS